MSKATIFGGGNMGALIASIFAAGGADVQHVTSSTTDVEVDGDIVVLAVPYAAVSGILSQHGAALADKIIVDITNPVDLQTFSLAVPPDSSAAAEVAAAVPTAHVLKAFNTNLAATLATKTIGGLPATILIAGDSEEAKAALSSVVSEAGFRAVDVGRLERARELEAIGYLQVALGVNEKISWTGGFAVVQ